MKETAECGNPLYWHNCYSGTYDLIHGDSMAHPAKMSPALCYRILRHLQELGLAKEEDTILDPMAGTGITNICAGAMGFKSISVELENKFVVFQQQNKEYAERRLYMALDWQMIKGDSRKLSELLGRDGLKSVTSPPYEQSITGGKSGIEWQEEWGKPSETRQPSQKVSYGETEGQIGNLRDTPLKSVMSPPYGETQEGGGLAKNPPKTFRGVLKEFTQSQGEEAGNIGNLSDKPLKSVMSPPYLPKEDRRVPWGGTASALDDNDAKRGYPSKGRQWRGAYSDDKENIGNPAGATAQESYLEAMTTVYSEIAKVSDVLVVVIKNPTRGGKLRRLDLDTTKILELAGWSIHCQHRSLLFEELEQADLFEGSKKKGKGRLSFFKRLSWQKGQPVASWEDIIICTRNGGG